MTAKFESKKGLKCTAHNERACCTTTTKISIILKKPVPSFVYLLKKL